MYVVEKDPDQNLILNTPDFWKVLLGFSLQISRVTFSLEWTTPKSWIWEVQGQPCSLSPGREWIVYDLLVWNVEDLGSSHSSTIGFPVLPWTNHSVYIYTASPGLSRPPQRRMALSSLPACTGEAVLRRFPAAALTGTGVWNHTSGSGFLALVPAE